jgi:UDP-2-acetamido-3-amino-2,3-dideoxy-glucuronate N-acetyltransferase
MDQEQMVTDRDDVKVAVLGCGAWGINHVRVWHEMGRLAMVCDPDAARLAAVAQAYPGVAVSSDPQEALGRADVAGVVIATPAVTHADLALDAIDAGKDVLVEKPLATAVGDAEKVVDLAASRGRILMVGHVLEYHPAVRTLHDLIAEGALGKLVYLYSNRLNFGRVRTEENALWSFAPHDVALLLRLMGEMPEEVAVRGAVHLSDGVADASLMSLRFPKSVPAHVFVSWLHPFKEHRFVVVGDRQMAVFDDTAPWEEKLLLYPHQMEWLDGRVPVARKADSIPVPLEAAEPLRVECEAFVDAVSTREAPLTDGPSGLAVLRVLAAGQRSLDRGGEPVPLERHETRAFSAHPTATIDEGARIGAGTRIWHHAHVMGGSRIGRDCVLGQNAYVGPHVRIGDGVKIQNNVSLYEGVELEDHVFCGPSVVFTNVVNPRSEIERKAEFRRTLVRRGATLGANATIVCGHTIGRYAFVAAGAVVTDDVPDHALVMGVPAKRTGWMCTCGERLAEGPMACSSCGRSFEMVSDAPVEVIA